MSMSLVQFAAEGEEHLRELPMPAYMYAVIALALFGLGLLVLWFFRGTAAKIALNEGRGDGHGDAHGHTESAHH